MSQTPPSNVIYIEKPRKKKWPWILGIIAALLLLILGGCAALIGGASKSVNDAVSEAATSSAATHDGQPAETEKSDTRTIELKATATGTGNVLHGAAGSTNTEQFEGEWSKTINDVPNKDGYVLTVTGDIMDPNSKVTCQVLVDGKVEKEATGTGSGGGASCILDAKFF